MSCMPRVSQEEGSLQLPQMKQLVETMSRRDFMSGSPEGVIQFLELPSVKLEDEGVRKQVLVRD